MCTNSCFTRAIVRIPGRSVVQGLTSSTLGPPSYELARQQHAAYVNALRHLGVEVQVLDAQEAHPDSTFVEDTAVVLPECAIIMNPGAPTRRGETADIERRISEDRERIYRVHPPGTADGGDVLVAGTHLYVGNSQRTNADGIRQILEITEPYGMTGSSIPLRGILHLKSGASYLDNNDLVVADELQDLAAFDAFNVLRIPHDEEYAANCLWVNGTVLVASGFPKTKRAIEILGYPTIALDMSEFQKLDGGLSCLSIRFS